MLKVIFITTSLGKEGANYEHIIRVHFLSRRCSLTILAPKRADFSQHVASGCNVITANLPGKFGMVIYGLLWLYKNRFRIQNAIVITEPSVMGVLGFVAKITCDSKWVVDVWDIPLRYLGFNKIQQIKNKLSKSIFRQLYRYADLFIVGIKDNMEFRYFRIPAEKVLLWQTTIWMPETFAAEPCKRTSDTFQILCMRSNHNSDMGLDILNQAFKWIEKAIPNVTLWIVGKVDKEVEPSIGFLKTNSRVHFTGLLEHKRLMQLIREVDLCVIPWRNVEDLAQTYPSKVMEYLTKGKVILASRLAGISEMIQDGFNGILTTPGDPNEISEKIIKLYQDKSFRDKISANARVYNERFDCRVKNDKILATLSNLIGTEYQLKTVSKTRTCLGRPSPQAEPMPNEISALYICSANPSPSHNNMNYFQRAYFLNKYCNLTIWQKKKSDFSCAAGSRAKLVSTILPGKIGIIIHTIAWCMIRRPKDQFDIVLTEPSTLGLCGFLIKHAIGCKWVVDIWDIPIRFVDAKNSINSFYSALLRRIIKKLYTKADLFLVSILPDIELAYFEIPKGKMVALPNGIWLETHKSITNKEKDEATQFNVLCMRTVYTADMGLDTLAQAYALLRDAIPGISLTIIGDIPSNLRSQVSLVEKFREVRFIKFVPHNKLKEMIRSASVCVVPFRDVPELAQTYPIKILEYKVLGRPVVASNIAGLRSLIEDGVNGLLFRAGDAADLAEKIHRLYRDDRLRNRIARNAAQYDPRFDCRVKNQAIVTELQRLVGASKACPACSPDLVV